MVEERYSYRRAIVNIAGHLDDLVIRGFAREPGDSAGSQDSGEIPMPRSSLFSVCSINHHSRCDALRQPGLEIPVAHATCSCEIITG
jgi:hypothetical protein